MSNVSRFLFKKTFFSSSMFATYFSGWYGTIHWEKHWNSIATSGDGLLERKRYFQDGWQRQKFLSHAEKLLSVDVKPTVQDDASVKSINLDVQSYADTLEIAKIESIVFFSKQWTISWIFSLKNQPITLYIIYLAFKIFSFNLHAKQRLKTLLEFGCGNGCFKNFLTRVYFPCPFAFSNHWQSLS